MYCSWWLQEMQTIYWFKNIDWEQTSSNVLSLLVLYILHIFATILMILCCPTHGQTFPTASNILIKNVNIQCPNEYGKCLPALLYSNVIHFIWIHKCVHSNAMAPKAEIWPRNGLKIFFEAWLNQQLLPSQKWAKHHGEVMQCSYKYWPMYRVLRVVPGYTGSCHWESLFCSSMQSTSQSIHATSMQATQVMESLRPEWQWDQCCDLVLFFLPNHRAENYVWSNEHLAARVHPHSWASCRRIHFQIIYWHQSPKLAIHFTMKPNFTTRQLSIAAFVQSKILLAYFPSRVKEQRGTSIASLKSNVLFQKRFEFLWSQSFVFQSGGSAKSVRFLQFK